MLWFSKYCMKEHKNLLLQLESSKMPSLVHWLLYFLPSYDAPIVELADTQEKDVCLKT